MLFHQQKNPKTAACLLYQWSETYSTYTVTANCTSTVRVTGHRSNLNHLVLPHSVCNIVGGHQLHLVS